MTKEELMNKLIELLAKFPADVRFHSVSFETIQIGDKEVIDVGYCEKV